MESFQLDFAIAAVMKSMDTKFALACFQNVRLFQDAN